MKKTFNRLLAATVAIPVALGQILAISANAAEDPAALQVTADQLLKVNAETGFPESPAGDTITYTVASDWNKTLGEKLTSAAADKTITLNAKDVVASINSTNYYAELLKDIVNASSDPTATVKDGVVTISGTANLDSYLAPQLADKLAGMDGYENVTLDTSILKNVAYTATINTDLENKKADAALTFTADGVDYTVSTATKYMQAVYDNLEAQIVAAVDQKVKKLAADTGLTEDEVRASADYDIAGDLAKLQAETDKLSSKIDAVNKKLDAAQSLTVAEKSYDSADAALAAALNYAVKKGVASAANVPNTVDGLAAKYGSAFDKGVASVNSSLKDAGVNVELAVSASDVAALAKSATKVTVAANAGDYTADLEIADAEYDAVVAYVEAQVAEKLPDKEVASVETVKTVKVEGSAKGSASFDVVRDVTVVLKDKTTTTTSTSETSGTTTSSGDTTVSTETTVSTDTTASSNTSDSTETSVSTDTTASSGSGSDTNTDTKTLPSNVSSVEVKLVDAKTASNVYLSSEESFDLAGLVESVTLYLEDGTTDETYAPADVLEFAETPASVYETVDKEAGVGKVYFEGTVALNYKGEDDITIDAAPTVAVALKGDTNLDGIVDSKDATEILTYAALYGVGQEPFFPTTKEASDLVTKLDYLVSDIDTESKAGVVEDGVSVIDSKDATYLLTYAALAGVGQDKEWAEIVK